VFIRSGYGLQFVERKNIKMGKCVEFGREEYW
jgi:hypothetical protein